MIENALEHGLEDKTEGGILKICFLANEKILEIHVEDNGENLSDDKIHELQMKMEQKDQITGIVNIHQRLKLFFGGKGGILIGRSKYGGAEVVICIPLK